METGGNCRKLGEGYLGEVGGISVGDLGGVGFVYRWLAAGAVG